MPILNYTTKVSVYRSINEIQKILVKTGATAVLVEYDDDREVKAMSFQAKTAHGILSFRLPANVDGVFAALQKEPKISGVQSTYEHAQKVAWRIIKDWIEAQMAIVQAGLADLPQVFLPYMQTQQGETVYELLKSQKFQALTDQRSID